MWYEHAAPGSNKILSVALRRNCLPTPVLDHTQMLLIYPNVSNFTQNLN